MAGFEDAAKALGAVIGEDAVATTAGFVAAEVAVVEAAVSTGINLCTCGSLACPTTDFRGTTAAGSTLGNELGMGGMLGIPDDNPALLGCRDVAGETDETAGTGASELSGLNAAGGADETAADPVGYEDVALPGYGIGDVTLEGGAGGGHISRFPLLGGGGGHMSGLPKLPTGAETPTCTVAPADFVGPGPGIPSLPDIGGV